jgi:two-component system chemotaxis sensor kinase CheA
MKELEQLVRAINQYEEGDLLSAADIREQAEELQKQADNEQLKQQLGALIELVEEIILGGTADGNTETLKGYARTLKEFMEEEEAAGNKEEADTEETVTGEQRAVEIEDPEILFSFLMEARDHLEDIEDRILELEKNPDSQTVHDIFRSMHTIKGVASFIGFDTIKDLSHRLETVLNAARDGELDIDDALIDILLEGGDTLLKMVYDLDSQAQKMEKQKPATAYEGGIDLSGLLKKLRPYLSKIESEEEAAAPAGAEEGAAGSGGGAESAGQGAEAEAGAGEGGEESTAEGPSGAQTGGGLSDLITDDMIRKFVEESSDLVDTAENAMLALEKDPSYLEGVEEAFRSVHTVKGNAGFFGFGVIEKMCMGIEGVLDTLRRGNKKADANITNLLLQSIDGLNESLGQVQRGEIRPGEPEEGGYTAEEALDRKEAGDYKPLGDMLVDMGIATREAVDQALDLQQMKLGQILVSQGEADPEEVSEAIEKQGKAAPTKQDQFASYRMKRKDIRVDTERLDSLFDLVGELITAEAMVVNNPDLEEVDTPSFDRSAGYLSKISRELQEITMSIRMIPLEGLFSKMRRLVRDLSKKFEKPINLSISGEDTEMDRNVMEEISDPLVHIIRNAVDHGIEPAGVRKERGKPEEGQVQLNAGYEGNEIWITVKDDGGGLDREKILSQAKSRGVIQTEGDELGDEEVYKLIFEPGFSTAEQVSEISGRGVGMDVVKKNLEKLRGRVDIRSVLGEGTTFILRIPLTLAIIDAVNFRVGPQLYSLPITDVMQFHKAEESEITETETGRHVINLRGEMIPVVKLAEFFEINGAAKGIEDGIVMVIQGRDKRLAAVVDEIVGYRQVVIKALPSYIENIRALSGCSILSDGKVSLIVDAAALISHVLE